MEQERVGCGDAGSTGWAQEGLVLRAVRWWEASGFLRTGQQSRGLRWCQVGKVTAGRGMWGWRQNHFRKGTEQWAVGLRARLRGPG